MNALTETREYRMRWITLVVIAISVLIVVLDSTIVNIALPTLQRELNTTLAELQWIITAYIMVFGALMLTTGSLADRWGRARSASLFLPVPAPPPPSLTPPGN